jgi:beta-N-acetylglucosaminidase
MTRKAYVFLIVSTLLVAGLLSLSTAFQARQDEIQELERKTEQQLQQMRDIREQLDEAAEHLAELEQMLLNLRQMERIVARGVPFRSGKPDATTIPVTTPSGFSATRFERAFAGTPLAGIGEALVQAEELYGINSLVLAAITVHESGWGSSRLAQDKNNLAGLGAYDGAEYSCGIAFDSRAESVMYLAQLLATHYAPGGKYYGGSHDLRGIGVKYASDPGWAAKVAGCMRVIMGRAAL